MFGMPRSFLIGWAVAAVSLTASIVLWGLIHRSSLRNPQTVYHGLPPVRMRKPAPDFSGTSLTGGKLTLADFRGKPLVLTFFASWCPPCRTDAPKIAALARHFGSRINVVGIDGGDTRTGVDRFLGRYGWRFPIMWDPDNNQYATFGVAGQPTTFVIDSRGTMVERFLGPIPTPVARRVIGDLLAG
jgi:peroxiredoxin